MTTDPQRLRLSEHAESRIRQRGFRERDIALVAEFGTPVDDGFVLTNRDAREAIAFLKAQVQRIERLKRTAVIEADGTVVTVMRADRIRCRRLLRGNSPRRERTSGGRGPREPAAAPGPNETPRGDDPSHR